MGATHAQARASRSPQRLKSVSSLVSRQTHHHCRCAIHGSVNNALWPATTTRKTTQRIAAHPCQTNHFVCRSALHCTIYQYEQPTLEHRHCDWKVSWSRWYAPHRRLRCACHGSRNGQELPGALNEPSHSRRPRATETKVRAGLRPGLVLPGVGRHVRSRGTRTLLARHQHAVCATHWRHCAPARGVASSCVPCLTPPKL